MISPISLLNFALLINKKKREPMKKKSNTFLALPKSKKSLFKNKLALPVAITILAFGVSNISQAQSTLNATGGHGTVGGDHFEYSIGEMAVVNTASAGNIVVTHGVLQPLSGTSSLEELEDIEQALSVYPNPTRDYVMLKPDLTGNTTLKYALYDPQGRVILQDDAQLHSGSEEQEVSLRGLPAGNYVLQVQVIKEKGLFLKSFKIQKLN